MAIQDISLNIAEIQRRGFFVTTGREGFVTTGREVFVATGGDVIFER
jgi:hypothetical protein